MENPIRHSRFRYSQSPDRDLRQSNSAVERPRRSRSGTAHGRTNGRRKKKEAERRQTRVYLLALRQARTLQGALACRRSTAVLPLGLTHPKVRRRTRFRGAGASMAGVSRRRQPRLQRAPRTPVIVPADLMSDTARVQRGRTLCARAPHPAPASRSHRLASLHEEREARAFIPKICRVKPNHWRALLFDSTTLFAVPSGNATVHTNLGELKSLICKPGACRHSAPYVFRYRSIRPTGAFSLRRNDMRN